MALGGPVQAQRVDAGSFERIRQALQRPPARLLALPKPDFFVSIEERRPLQDIFERPPWVSPPPEFPPPPGSNRDPHDATAVGMSIDPVALAQSISRGIRTRRARGEVQRAIAEYCSAHGEEAGAAAICGDARR